MLEREQYEYLNNLSEEANEKLKIHHEIYEDIRMIVKDDHSINSILGIKSNLVSDEQLQQLNKYTDQYLTENIPGILRTVLINIKPFIYNSLIEQKYKQLVQRYDLCKKLEI